MKRETFSLQNDDGTEATFDYSNAEGKLQAAAFGVVKGKDGKWSSVLSKRVEEKTEACTKCRGYGPYGNPLCGAVYTCSECGGDGKITPGQIRKARRKVLIRKAIKWGGLFLVIGLIIALLGCSPEKQPDKRVNLTPRRPLSWHAKGYVTLEGMVKVWRDPHEMRVMIDDYIIDILMLDVEVKEIIGKKIRIKGNMIERDNKNIIFADFIEILSD